jgi:hypothetical protein
VSRLTFVPGWLELLDGLHSTAGSMVVAVGGRGLAKPNMTRAQRTRRPHHRLRRQRLRCCGPQRLATIPAIALAMAPSARTTVLCRAGGAAALVNRNDAELWEACGVYTRWAALRCSPLGRVGVVDLELNLLKQDRV